MTTIAERIDAARAHRLAMATLRLRLKPRHRSCGFVQGAWWPRSTTLAGELPSLLKGLAPRFGVIDEVFYHLHDWSPTPTDMKHLGREVILQADLERPNVMAVLGRQFGRLELLVVPAYTDATDAYTAMTTAADAGDASTPDQLLGRSERSAKDRRHARIALHRWESEGGAVFSRARRERDSVTLGS